MIIVSKPKISCEPKKISLRGDPTCDKDGNLLWVVGVQRLTWVTMLVWMIRLTWVLWVHFFLDTVLEIKGEGG